MYLTSLGAWGCEEREKDATGPQCPCYDAVEGLSESQGSVLQTGPIKYQFDPTLVDVERATLLACDTIDINSSRMSLAWMIPQMRTTETYFVKIQYVDKFLIFSETDKDSHLELIGKLKQCFGIYNGVFKCLLALELSYFTLRSYYSSDSFFLCSILM